MNHWMRRAAETRKRVLELTVRGYSVREIAQELHLSPRTIKSHRERLFVQHGIKSGLKHVILASKYIERGTQQLPFPVQAKRLLSPRFYTVCCLVGKGLTSREIGNVIGTTSNTVKNYVRLIFDLTGTSNRIELMTWWEAHKIPAPGES